LRRRIKLFLDGCRVKVNLMLLKNTIVTLFTVGLFSTPSMAAITDNSSDNMRLDTIHQLNKLNDNDFNFEHNKINTVHKLKLATSASWYGPGFFGNTTACGQVYNSSMVSAAHRSLPCGTRVRVTNKENGRSVVVTINDRGPFVGGRVLDMSNAAADMLGMKSSGVVPINMEVLR
jgi:rare lipoprotein A (peptidoglycan hydrolase)